MWRRTYLAFILTQTLTLIPKTHSLTLNGDWDTDEFFLFLAKFGFQKTTPQEKELTEGYIFGNISSFSASKPDTWATLVLLPRQYFVDFYRNRTWAKTDPNKACQLMFQVSIVYMKNIKK